MQYVFAALVILNGALFGYFVAIHDSQAETKAKLAKVESELTQKIDFQNTSEHVPPLIGTKK